MAKEEKIEKVPVNAGEMEVELVEKLDLMCVQDENNRSQFIRKLIRQEWYRRHQLELGLEIPSTLPSSKGKGNLNPSPALPKSKNRFGEGVKVKSVVA